MPEAVNGLLTLFPRTFLPKLGDLFKGQDKELGEIDTGYEDLHSSLLVKSNSDYFTRGILSSHTIRQGLIELKTQAKHMQFTITGKRLYFHERSNITDPLYLAAVINLLMDIADYARRYG